MAYNPTYRAEFKSQGNIDWKIDIIDTDAVGTPTIIPFNLTENFFSLDYKGKDRWDAIIASELSLSCLVEDSDFEAIVGEVAISNEGRFLVRVYKNTVFWWGGVMVNDLLERENIDYPYELELTFTDGLGLLKDADFWVQKNYFYTGAESFIGIIEKLLLKTGNLANWAGSGEMYMATNVNWYDANHNFYVNYDPLFYSRVLHEAFQGFEDDRPTPGNCYKILENILLTFNAKIMLCQGIYKIFNFDEPVNTSRIWRYYSLYAHLESPTVLTNMNDSFVNFLQGGQYGYLPGLYSVEKIYHYKASPEGENLLPPLSSYTPHIHTFNGAPGGILKKLQFSGKTVQTYTLTGATPQYGIYMVYRMDVIITKADGTKAYLYNTGDGKEPYAWSVSSLKYVTQLSYYNGGYGTTNEFDMSFITTFLPWNAVDVQFEFQLLGWTNNTILPLIIIPYILFTFSFYCKDFLLSTLFSNATDKAEGNDTFTALNGAPNNKSKLIKLPDSNIGDGHWDNSIGAIFTSKDYGTTWLNSTLWKIKAQGTGSKLMQLGVNQCLSGQRLPASTYLGSVISLTYSADKTAIFPDASKWFALNCSFDARNDTWKGIWWKLGNLIPTTHIGIDLDENTYDDDLAWDEDSNNVTDWTEDEAGVVAKSKQSSAGFLQTMITSIVTTISQGQILTGEKKTGVDAGVLNQLSLTDDYLYVCVFEGEIGVAIWKKILMFQTT